MSPQPQDVETQNKSRPRSNTASFSAFAWRRQKDTASVPSISSVSPHSLPLEDLIQALTPPAVPSLSHARALASFLSTHSPLPCRSILHPILASLCDADSPVAIQTAGYEILAAYCENNEAPSLTTAERLTYFSLFRGSTNAWALELWEPRFKAVRALTKYGIDIIGIEIEFLDVLKFWIEGGFRGLLKDEGVLERTERAERERSVDILVKFISDVLGRLEISARISEENLTAILNFYADLVDRSILSRNKAYYQDRHPSGPDLPSVNSTPSKSSTPSHRRHPSSISGGSIVSPNFPISIPTKHPVDISVSVYLQHLSSCIKTLSAIHLDSILPVLFRALAFCSSPLPRLSVLPHPAKKASSEDKVTETLNALFSGPYSTTCMRILKQYLSPPSHANGTVVDLSSVESTEILMTAVQTSLGAHRTLRNYIRRALATRLARAYILRESSMAYSPSGLPANLNVERDLMERAWPKEDYTSSALGLGRNGWDAGRLGKVLTKSVEAWVWWQLYEADSKLLEGIRVGKEEILEEAAGILKDIWQELDSRGEEEKGELDEEEACVIGETLKKLVEYVLPLRNQDGSPFILPLCRSPLLPSPLLRSLAALLSRDHATPTNPLLSTILIHLADNLTDADTANLPRIMADQHDLYPTSPDWLNNWQGLLKNRSLVSVNRPLTGRAVMGALESVYESVRDMRTYRESLADLVLEVSERSLSEPDDQHASHIFWKILGDEVVLRTVDYGDNGTDTTSRYIDTLVATACEMDVDEEDICDSSVGTADQSPSPSGPQSSVVSPILSRTQSEYPTPVKERERGSDKDSTLPSVMSILSSLTAGHSSRSPVIPEQTSEDLPDGLHDLPLAEPPPTFRLSRAVASVAALITIFAQIVFTPFSLGDQNVTLAVRVFNILVNIALEGKSTRGRLTALQFLMRLRADRCHRLYFINETEPHVVMLSSLIHRVWVGPLPVGGADLPAISVFRFARERDGRQVSRGRRPGGATSRSTDTPSRSRSRATTVLPQTSTRRTEMPAWHAHENLPFVVAEADLSEGLTTYDPEGDTGRLILPISSYLCAIVSILEQETNWEIVSYVLCHLPVQLSNKHLFCGPKSRKAISRLLSVICAGILNGELASHLTAPWPPGRIKPRDAHGLAYHSLSVLVSYRRCFDLKQCHLLVEAFQNGLNGQIPAIKCCLDALSLSAFELQPSMTKYLPRILEMLSQIMSNASVAVHILSFLWIVICVPQLYANFTEDDYKMVFGVALQYLQHYNRPDSSTTSWALSEHMRILSYAVVYGWFLRLKVPDRVRHIPFITRQLLLANEGKEVIDEPTEVCFDWLSRYTYASADPRPAPSVFNDILMAPSSSESSDAEMRERTWIVGYSVITIRTLTKRGWLEVLCRRPSGFSKFLCRAENLPMVGAGDVDPDLLSIPATLMAERNPLVAISSDKTDGAGLPPLQTGRAEVHQIFEADKSEDPDPTSRPNPVTGYVWSGSAPSQRRKTVAIHPSYFALQLSGYPERVDPHHSRVIADPAIVARFVGSLDRIPVIDTHTVGILYVAPGQRDETEILGNTHGSPAYTRFLERLGRLINLRGQVDVYAGGLDPDEDGEYAYAWWDDIAQILYHTATMMPTTEQDPRCNNKKRHIGNDYVRIVWNDSGLPYQFDTLSTQFQFLNIIIEPHSFGAIAAFSNYDHENEYFKVTMQRADGMPEFGPVGHFKLISAETLPLFIRQLSQLADWFVTVFAKTNKDTERREMKTNWRSRLEAIRRFKQQVSVTRTGSDEETLKDFTSMF